MATLSTQEIDLDGLNPSMSSAAGGGDAFTPDDRTFLLVTNGGGSPITVTVATPGTELGGQLTRGDSATSVTNGQSRYIGPFPAEYFVDPATGLAGIAYSAATSVTVAVLRVPARA